MNIQFTTFFRYKRGFFTILLLLLSFYANSIKAEYTLLDEFGQTITLNSDSPLSLVGFENPTFIAHEGESVSITVRRYSGIGQLSINYITKDNSAFAGVDYVHTEGTLFWNDGEIGAKTFTVSILNNSNLTGNIIVDLELSAESGQAFFDFKSMPLVIVDNQSSNPDMSTLSVSVAGTGIGMISAEGLDCGVNGTDCAEDYVTGSSLIITPTPRIEGANFIRWLGDCDFIGRVELTGNKYCTAVFSSIYTLALNIPQTTVLEGETITGKLERTGSTVGQILVKLDNSDTTELTMPYFVILPDGANSVNFPITVVDDAEIDDVQPVIITASEITTSEKIINTDSIGVLDNDKDLKLAVTPLVFSEDVGTLIGTISRPGNLGDMTINLSSSDFSEVIVPQTVTIADGQTSAEFEVTVVNDVEADGTQSVELTANQTVLSLQVLDNEILVLEVEPQSFEESMDNQLIATLSRNGEIGIDDAIDVTLINNHESKISVPATVTIEAGQKTAQFNIQAVDDDVVDGTQMVILTASHPQYTSGEVTLEVNDNDCRLESFDVSYDRVLSLDRFGIAALNVNAFCAFDDDVIENLSPEAFQGFDADRLNKLRCESLKALSLEQFHYIPETALSGLTARTMGCLPSDIVFEIGLTDLNSFDVRGTEISEDLGRFLNNLNTEQISVEDVLNFLPSGWMIDAETGELTAPPGAKLGFKAMQYADLTPQIGLPELPNFNTGFGLGGWSREGKNVLDNLNKSLLQAETDNANILKYFTFSQDEHTGIVTVIGFGEFEGVHLSLIPDVDNMIQVDVDVPVGLSIDKNGQFVMTTPNGYQIPLIPAPQIEKALEVSSAGYIKLGAKGDTLAVLPDESGGENFATVIFDSFIKSAPEGANAGVYVKKARSESVVKSTRSGEESGNQSEVMVVYSDGTAQTVYPTVSSPETFMQEAYKIPGVEKVTYNMDGTFTIIFLGKELIVEPTFLVLDEDVPEGEEVNPDISIDSSMAINYVVEYKAPKDSTKASSRRKKLTYSLPIRCVNDTGLNCLDK